MPLYAHSVWENLLTYYSCQHHIIKNVHIVYFDRHVRQNSIMTPPTPRFPTPGIFTLYRQSPPFEYGQDLWLWWDFSSCGGKGEEILQMKLSSLISWLWVHQNSKYSGGPDPIRKTIKRKIFLLALSKHIAMWWTGLCGRAQQTTSRKAVLSWQLGRKQDLSHLNHKEMNNPNNPTQKCGRRSSSFRGDHSPCRYLNCRFRRS